MLYSSAVAGAVADDRVQRASEIQQQAEGQGVSALGGLDAVEAVSRLMARQNLSGVPAEFVPGYERERTHIKLLG